jgi:hypothetical protein
VTDDDDDDDNGNNYDEYKRLIFVLLQNLRPYSLGTGNSSQQKPGTERRTFFPRQMNTGNLIAGVFEPTAHASPLSQYWYWHCSGTDGNYITAQNFMYGDVTIHSQK